MYWTVVGYENTSNPTFKVFYGPPEPKKAFEAAQNKFKGFQPVAIVAGLHNDSTYVRS
jgi:hypothetical protein